MQFHLQIKGLKLRSESGNNSLLQLAPKPQWLNLRKGSIEIDSKVSILSNLPQKHNFIVEQLTEEIKRMLSNNVSIQTHQIPPDDKMECDLFADEIEVLPSKQKKNFLDQGYVLYVIKNMQLAYIWAPSAQGIFYGVQTLFQIANSSSAPGRYILPHVEVLDYPNVEIRGISDDVSRGQMATIGGFKKFIRALSRFKMNHYFIYIEDIFKFQSHPEIGEERGAIGPEGVKEIQDYGKKYFVTVSPIFESLGHMDNILSLNQFVKYAEFPGSDCLDVSNPEIYDFLDDLYGDLCEAFDSPHFHVGCDESWELGTFHSRDYIKEKGKGKVILDHYQKLYDLAKKHGKDQIYIYHDIAIDHDEILENLPKDINFVYWDYSSGGKLFHKNEYPKLDDLVEAGYQTIVSPAVQDWSRFFPDMAKMEDNTNNILDYGHKKGTKGVIQSSWGDFRNENFRDNRIYGFAYASCKAWNITDFSSEEFWNAFLLHFFEDDIVVSPLMKETLDFIRKLFVKLGKRDYFTLLWAHPFATPICEFDTDGFFELITQLEEKIDNFKTIMDKNPKNKHFIRIMGYTLRLYRFLLKKLIVSNIGNSLKESIFKEMPAQQQKYFYIQLEDLKKEILELKDEYKELWLKYCSEANLKPILDQFEWLAQFFTEKLVQVKNEQYQKNPNIPSEWIFHIKKRKKGQAMHSYFRKTITIPEEVEKAYIQVIGDTHVKVYINGKQIEEFYSKRTLSVRMLNNMVKIIDLTPYWKNGENTLTIENINYKTGYGIINVYGEVYLKEYRQKVVIKSDKSWTATHKRNEQWIAGEKSLSSEKEPKSLGAPPMLNGSLSYPKFEEELPSHHTNLLGFTNCELLIHTPRYLTWLLKWLSKIALKRGLLI